MGENEEVIEALKKIPEEHLDEIVEAVKEKHSKDDAKVVNNKDSPSLVENKPKSLHQESDDLGLSKKKPAVNDKRTNLLAGAGGSKR